MELGGKDRKSSFTDGSRKVSSLFIGFTIFSCERCNGGVHCELVMGKYITCNGVRVIIGGLVCLVRVHIYDIRKRFK